MLKLNAAQEPFWLEILPGQRTQFRPITTAMILAARNQGSRVAMAGLQERKDAAEPGFAASVVSANGEYAFTHALAKLGIVAWEGVGDAEGNPVDAAPENVDAYLSNWQVFDRIDKLYVVPALARSDEKNASPPSRNGTTGAKTQARTTAGTVHRRARNVPTK